MSAYFTVRDRPRKATILSYCRNYGESAKSNAACETDKYLTLMRDTMGCLFNLSRESLYHITKPPQENIVVAEENSGSRYL